jgi:hypothetical protein
MTNDIAILNRQGAALFNFWSKKGWNDRHIGDLSLGDFIEMITFLAELEIENARN